MNRITERLYNGIVKENPTFVMMLGMCPTLAVTTSATNGLGMGLTTMVVLALSNTMISALRHVIPEKVRIPSYIVIVASFVTIVQMILQAYLPSLNDSLGIFIPLIVVNCIILGRAESYASKNPVIPSLFDGIGMGLGFTLALTVIGLVRELIGAGTIFGFTVLSSSFYTPVTIFIMAPGAFFVLAVLTALQNKFRAPSATNENGGDFVCGGNCATCMGRTCEENRAVLMQKKEEEQKAAKEAAAAKKMAAAKKTSVSETEEKGGHRS